MPPVDALGPNAPAELVDALTQWHALAATAAEHRRKQSAATAATERAGANYQTAIHDAIAKGSDPGKIKNQTEQHKATADAHAQFARQAEGAQTRLGVTLGQLLEQHAPELYAGADTVLEETAREVQGTLDLLRTSWSRWSAAFAHRRWLSGCELSGGEISNYHGSSPLPKEVAAALDVIANHLGEPDRLRSDEEQVRAWRQHN